MYEYTWSLKYNAVQHIHFLCPVQCTLYKTYIDIIITRLKIAKHYSIYIQYYICVTDDNFWP